MACILILRFDADCALLVLDMLATDPDYHGKGAGTMLVRWGCELADKDGVATYLDASKAGKRLYERYGFVDRGDPEYCQDEMVSMVRDERK